MTGCKSIIEQQRKEWPSGKMLLTLSPRADLIIFNGSIDVMKAVVESNGIVCCTIPSPPCLGGNNSNVAL
jgi:hypothetical protein